MNSTGLTLWRASPLLCKYLIENISLVSNRYVLELGAGLGLCGILAAGLGAKEVCITDGDSFTLASLRENIARNIVLCPPSKVSCRQLRWGIKLMEFQSHCGQTIPDGQFDVILGSDIIYVESILTPLFETVSHLLQPDGIFILAYARRNVKIDRVLSTATQYGFKWTDPSNDEGCYIFSRIKIMHLGITWSQDRYTVVNSLLNQILHYKARSSFLLLLKTLLLVSYLLFVQKQK